MGKPHGEPSAQAQGQFHKPRARSDLFARRVEQAIDRQDEKFAVQTVELVAAMTIGTIDSQPARLSVVLRISADELAPRELAKVREQVAHGPCRLFADEG